MQKQHTITSKRYCTQIYDLQDPDKLDDQFSIQKTFQNTTDTGKIAQFDSASSKIKQKKEKNDNITFERFLLKAKKIR